MVIHLTEKLRRKLHVPPLWHAGVEVPAHLRWYANVFTAQRVHYLIATNAASLYSVVWYGRGITDDSDFLRYFIRHLGEQLSEDGLQATFERCILPHTGNMTLLKTQDRSVLGSMNDMVQACQFMLSHRDVSPFELGGHLNDMPFRAIKYRLPREVFGSLPCGPSASS